MAKDSQDPTGMSAALADRFAALLGENERLNEPAVADRIEFAARLAMEWPVIPGPTSPPMPDAEQVMRIAAWVDGALGARGSGAAGGCASQALQEALASLEFIERVTARSGRAPAEWVEAAIATWRPLQRSVDPGTKVISLRRDRPESAAAETSPLIDTFLLLAAADGARDSAIVCRSESGLWTLEVFIEDSGEGEQSERGYLLLSVHPDHRKTYEGRNARIYVVIDGAERILVDAPVRAGEVYAPIALAGLDLWCRDAINVVFTSVQNEN